MNYISIFCGAHEGKNPKYAEAARSVSECIAKKGINVVFETPQYQVCDIFGENDNVNKRYEDPLTFEELKNLLVLYRYIVPTAMA